MVKASKEVAVAVRLGEAAGLDFDPQRLPRHVAVIMDGNGRWAKERGLLRMEGHRAGVEALRRTIQACHSIGVPTLTVFAFSTENWQRPAPEVDFLMRLLEEVLQREFRELHANNVRIRVIGQRSGLSKGTLQRIHAAEQRTCENTGLSLNVAWNYGGRMEIAGAARRIAELVASGQLDPAAIDEASFAGYLDTCGIPDPDLLIRTGGEYRISNFLLWQLAYAELWVTPTFWPDFCEAHLVEALVEFQRRERRFGRV